MFHSIRNIATPLVVCGVLLPESVPLVTTDIFVLLLPLAFCRFADVPWMLGGHVVAEGQRNRVVPVLFSYAITRCPGFCTLGWLHSLVDRNISFVCKIFSKRVKMGGAHQQWVGYFLCVFFSRKRYSNCALAFSKLFGGQCGYPFWLFLQSHRPFPNRGRRS
jgi:hypothetical protein